MFAVHQPPFIWPEPNTKKKISAAVEFHFMPYVGRFVKLSLSDLEISGITMNSASGKLLFKQTCQETERQFIIIHSCAVSQAISEGIGQI